MSSALINATSNTRLTPAMVTVLWVIGDKIDGMKLKDDPASGLWLKIPSAKLRGSEGRNDNIWLRTCLERLSEIRIGGEYRGDPWGAVMVSEWHITQGGTVTEILIPPAAVQTLRAPETFAKIEAYAAYKLQGPSRRLYVILADKKRLRQDHWSFPLDELRALLGVADKKSYQRWNNFRQWVLDPAVESINDFGTVKIKMTPEKTGRAVDAVRFDWEWKNIDEVRVTDEENERHVSARHKIGDGSAPPLTDASPLPQLAKIVRDKVEDAQWRSWFEKCEFQEDEAGRITVIAPSDFHAKFIKENFQETLNNAGWSIGEKRQGTVPVISADHT